ncbi:hypothetical protein BGZ73_006945 [Actinomortierella ambigua]|nr:hypothetical protein BGZ73_006945 [Actinomortierella ambigua]
MLRSAPDSRPQKSKAKSIAQALKLKKDKSGSHAQQPLIPPRATSLNALVSPRPQQQPQAQPEERWTVVESHAFPPLKNVPQYGTIVEVTPAPPTFSHAKKGSWSPSFQVIPEVREPQDEPGANQAQGNGQGGDRANSDSDSELVFNLSADPSPATAFLIREIQRLASHDFDHHGKPAPFPQELQSVFQKICDLSVCLRSAKKNARNSPFSRNAHLFGGYRSPSNGGGSPWTSRPRTLTVSSPSKRPFEPSTGVVTTIIDGSQHHHHHHHHNNNNNNSSSNNNKGADSRNSHDGTASTAALHQQQQEIIQDLEHQLAQSRKAHYELVQAHITNISRQFSPLASPSASSTVLSSSGILGLESRAGSSGGSGGGNDSSSDEDDQRGGLLAKMLSESQVLESLMQQQQENQKQQQENQDEQQHQQQQQQPTPSRPLIEAGSTSSPKSSTAFSKRSSTVGAGSGSNLKLSTIGHEAEFNHLALKQVMKRLLEAQKELGMLKMMMVQSQGDIQELEEEILLKEEQLKRHYDLFHSLVTSQQLGLQIKVDQGTERIRQLETLVDQCTKEHVERLQREIQDSQAQLVALNASKDSKQDKIAQLEALVATLEAEIATHESTVQALQASLVKAETAAKEAEAKFVVLTQELESQRVKMEASLDENMDMMEHMTKEHKKKLVEMSSNLRKSRNEARRFQQETQQMALKIVRLQNLNEALEEKAEKDKVHIQSLLDTIESHTQTIDQLQLQLEQCQQGGVVVVADNDSVVAKHAHEIASLETKIEELELMLRAKDSEMEQAVEAAEKLTLRLEESETRTSEQLADLKQQHEQAIKKLREDAQTQAQLERKLVGQSVTLYQGMAARLEKELSETQEKLRETMLCWGHTKEQCMRFESSYRKKKRELEETTKSLEEVHFTLARLGDAIGLLEHEKEVNQKLSEEIQRRDEELLEMEQRLRQLETSD